MLIGKPRLQRAGYANAPFRGIDDETAGELTAACAHEKAPTATFRGAHLFVEQDGAPALPHAAGERFGQHSGPTHGTGGFGVAVAKFLVESEEVPRKIRRRDSHQLRRELCQVCDPRRRQDGVDERAQLGRLHPLFSRKAPSEPEPARSVAEQRWHAMHAGRQNDTLSRAVDVCFLAFEADGDVELARASIRLLSGKECQPHLDAEPAQIVRDRQL